MFWGRVQDYRLPTPLACFLFTSPTERLRVPSGFKWALLDLFYFVSLFYCHPLRATSKYGLFQMTLTKQNITCNFPLKPRLQFPNIFSFMWHSILNLITTSFDIIFAFSHIIPLWCGPGSSVGIATELRAGRFGIKKKQSRWGWDFPPFQTGPGAHPASCKMSTGSLPEVKCGRGVLLTTHPLLVLRSWKSRANLYPPSGPHRACNGKTFPFLFLCDTFCYSPFYTLVS